MMDSFCNIDLYFFDQHVKMTTQFLVDNMYLYRVQRHSRAIVEKKNKHQETHGNQEK